MFGANRHPPDHPENYNSNCICGTSISLPLAEILDALRAGGHLDFMCEADVARAAGPHIELEATEKIGAARYERTDNRSTHRNGSRSRLLSTKAGDLELVWAAVATPDRMAPWGPGVPTRPGPHVERKGTPGLVPPSARRPRRTTRRQRAALQVSTSRTRRWRHSPAPSRASFYPSDIWTQAVVRVMP